MSKIAAIIPAGGYSSRMGFFKPLLPLGEASVIENTITTFLAAGIDDIYVVVGHRAHLLKPVVERLGGKWIENIHYEQGMYSSVMAGVSALKENTDAFFLLPADTPLVLADTVKELINAYNERPCDVLYPVYQGKKGHPPLISSKLRPLILQGEVQGGLKALLNEVANTDVVNTEDDNILKDLDTQDDYRNMLASALANYPTSMECEQILQEYNVLERVVLHAWQVAKLAGAMALYLNSRGHRLHLALLFAACLLHDIAKGEPQHARRGQQRIETRGFHEVASIIGTHMDLPDEYVQQINEHSLLYLADKMIKGTTFVSVAQRKAEKLSTFIGNPEAQQAVQKKLDLALFLQKEVERLIGVPIEKLAGEELQ